MTRKINVELTEDELERLLAVLWDSLSREKGEAGRTLSGAGRDAAFSRVKKLQARYDELEGCLDAPALEGR